MTPEDNIGEAQPPPAGEGSLPGSATGGPPASGSASGAAQPATQRRGNRRSRGSGANMLPEREGRRFGLERLLVRLVATTGIIGIGVALGAILTSQKVQGWIVGLVIAVVTVVLSGILWSSKQL